MSLSERLANLDRFQQRRPRIGFAVAVLKKFSDDQAGSLAALISYYGFVSIFPLLLLFVTILGFVIHGNPAEQAKLLNGTLGQVPLLRNQLAIRPISGHGYDLVIGTLGVVLGGLGVTNSAQNAFNRIWQVPFKQRPNFLKARLRGLRLLVVLGVLNVVSTTAAGFTTASAHGALAELAGVVVALVFNLALFMAAFRLLTAAEDVEARDLWPGVVSGAVGWQILQHLGGYFSRKVTHETTLYGEFGLVLGLLAFLYLGAQIMIIAAEVNVVRKRRLWPRSLFGPALTDADMRSLTGSAEVEERVESENVEVSFGEPAPPADPGPGSVVPPGGAAPAPG